MPPKIWSSKPANDTKDHDDTQPLVTPTGTVLYSKDALQNFTARLESTPTYLLLLGAFGLGLAGSVGGKRFYTRYGRRLKNGDWVTPDIFAEKRWIRGIVTSVGDGDNFRLFHTPPLGGWRWPFNLRRVPTLTKELKGQTLHIRIAGVDAPEGAHFGKPAQEHSGKSLAWLRKKILGKPLYCQLIKRDQYTRIIANVYLAPRLLPGAFFYGKSLSIEMLRAGWATTYTQEGAEYGIIGKDEHSRIEKEAKAARRGMWVDGVDNVETPAEYKRRTNSPVDSSPPLKKKRNPRKTSDGWLSRLFRNK